MDHRRRHPTTGRKYRSHYGYAPAQITDDAQDTLRARLADITKARAARALRRAERLDLDPLDMPRHIVIKIRQSKKEQRA